MSNKYQMANFQLPLFNVSNTKASTVLIYGAKNTGKSTVLRQSLHAHINPEISYEVAVFELFNDQSLVCQVSKKPIQIIENSKAQLWDVQTPGVISQKQNQSEKERQLFLEELS